MKVYYLIYGLKILYYYISIKKIVFKKELYLLYSINVVIQTIYVYIR